MTTKQRGKIQRHSKASTANSVWQTFAGKTTHNKFGLASGEKMVFASKTKRGDTANSARRKCSGACRQSENGSSVWAEDFSLSLLALVARLWVKFKGLFCSFYRSFISFYCRFCSFHSNFILSQIFLILLWFFLIFL